MKHPLLVMCYSQLCWPKGSNGRPPTSQPIVMDVSCFPQMKDKSLFLKRTLQNSGNMRKLCCCLPRAFISTDHGQGAGRYSACCQNRRVNTKPLQNLPAIIMSHYYSAGTQHVTDTMLAISNQLDTAIVSSKALTGDGGPSPLWVLLHARAGCPDLYKKAGWKSYEGTSQ